MENIFLVPDSGEHKRRLGRIGEEAESQAERNVGCYLTCLSNVWVWLPAQLHHVPYILLYIERGTGKYPLGEKIVHPQNKVRTWEGYGKH